MGERASVAEAQQFEVVVPSTGEVLEFDRSGMRLPGVASAVGLELPEALTVEDWLGIGQSLQGVDRSLQWWIGDWLRFGERRYGETYAQAMDATEASYDTLKAAKWVSERIELVRRRTNLSWSHHKEVAALAPADQDAWLDAATSEGWSRQELRQQIKSSRREAELAEHFRTNSTGSLRLAKADAHAFLESLEPESIDLLLTDPPYMTDVENIEAFAAGWVPLAMSRLKSSGRAYIFTGAYPRELAAYIPVLQAEADKLGWTLSNVLVWVYRNTIGPAPTNAYKLNWQACFYLYGPDAPPLSCPVLVEQFSVQDVNAPDARNGVRFHAWQKPDELADRLVRHASMAGDSVLDPFCGTGTFMSAAMRLGRNGIGCEVDDEMLALCRRRGLVF